MSSLSNDPYLKALCKGVDTTTTQQYYQKRMEESPSYSVAEVDYRQFRVYGYERPRTWGAWTQKKLTHLVGPVVNGIKIPLHILKAITVSPCLGTFTRDMYHVGTDIQRIKGNIKGLIWLPLGEHDLASADFHDKCYAMMGHGAKEATSKKVLTQEEIDRLGTGLVYVGLTQDELDKTPVSEIPEVVKTLNSERLFKLKFSEEQLKAIPLESLSKAQVQGLFPPFNLSKGKEATALFSELLARQRKGEELKRNVAFERLRAFSFVELKAIQDKLPPECLELHKVAMAFNNLQRIGLTKELFNEHDPEIIVQALLMETLGETIQRLHVMELDLLHQLLPHLTVEILIKLNDETFHSLDFAHLTPTHINHIFNTKQKKETQPIVMRLSPAQVNELMPRLEGFQIHTFDFSNDQLKDLDLSKLSLSQLQNLLPYHELSVESGSVAVQKKFAEKQLVVLERINAFQKEGQQAVIKDKLPDLWALFEAWKKGDKSNSQVSALEHLAKIVIELPKTPDKKKKIDPKSVTEVSEKIPETILGKVHYYAVAFFTHVWNGLCVVTSFVTYPIWKPYKIAKEYFYANKSVESLDDIV